MASQSGIDSFALNLGTNQPWEIAQVQSAYDAAQQSGTGFKMFISLDMRYTHSPFFRNTYSFRL